LVAFIFQTDSKKYYFDDNIANISLDILFYQYKTIHLYLDISYLITIQFSGTAWTAIDDTKASSRV